MPSRATPTAARSSSATRSAPRSPRRRPPPPPRSSWARTLPCGRIRSRALLERTAADVERRDRLLECPLGRDPLAGWGRVDVTAALERLTDGTLPRADAFEPNDDAGAWSRPFAAAADDRRDVDYWDDQIDVYSVTLSKAQRLFVRLSPPATDRGEASCSGSRGRSASRACARRVSFRAAQSARVGAQERLSRTPRRRPASTSSRSRCRRRRLRARRTGSRSRAPLSGA